MNKALSYKVLLPLGLVLWIGGKIAVQASPESVIFDAVTLLGFIILVMGIIAGISAFFKRNKKVE